ncbi:MAG: zincin-like metallopeptidase domain-containing protein, partial [Bacteroidota bacterium]
MKKIDSGLWMPWLLTVFLLAVICPPVLSQTASRASSKEDLPTGYWSIEKSQPIIDKVQTILLATDLSHLSAGERKAVDKLMEVGRIFQGLYEKQRHPEAVSSSTSVARLDKHGSTAATQNLLTLYRLFQGPIATTLENKRESFLPVDDVQPGKNVYPWGMRKEEVDAVPVNQRERVMGLRTVVRAGTQENLAEDLATLKRYPALETLHPRLREDLSAVTPGEAGQLYAIPYSIAYADELMKSFALLNEGADAVEQDDAEFARYLRNRSRDLLSNDYESGDAAWVTGHFKNLNAQIGAYETYDDELFGVKTFFALSVLIRRQDETAALRTAMKGLQTLEDSLPYDHHKRVREDIPVGVYDVIADFGQARGGNTATILPNESYLTRRYGRTILLRANIMQDPAIYQSTSGVLTAAIGLDQAKELTPDGNFYRTLWHEVGHYLGVDRTKDNRDLDEALLDNASVMEELKADLVSLFVARTLAKQGYYSEAGLRSVYASGILRVLQNNKPRRDQPYNTMQLMQWNFFLENGLLSFDR